MTNKSKQKSVSDEELIELCANKAAQKLKTKMKSMFDQALEDVRKSYHDKIAALRARIVEMKQSQDFVCAQCRGAETPGDIFPLIIWLNPPNNLSRVYICIPPQ